MFATEFTTASYTIYWSLSSLQQSEAVVRKCFLKNFTEFTETHLCQSLFFNKVAGLRPATLLRKRLWHRCFSVNFVKFLRAPTSTEHPW